MDDAQFEELTEAQKKVFMEKKKGIFVMRNPKIMSRGYLLSINILKGEGFPPCDSNDKCNSFFTVRVTGSMLQTRVVSDNYNPTFNTKLSFPIFMPILNDKIIVRAWS